MTNTADSGHLAVIAAHLGLPVHIVQSPQVDDLRQQRRLNVVTGRQLQQGEFRRQGLIVLALLALQSSLCVKDLLGRRHSHVAHKLLNEVQGADVAAVLLERGQGSVLLGPVVLPDVRQENISHYFRIPFPVIAALLQQLSQELVIALVRHGVVN